MRQRTVRFLLDVDYLSDGIRGRLLVAAAVLQVFFAPLWDQYLRGGNPEHKASSHEPVTFLATFAFLGLGLILIAGRLLALSAVDEDGDNAPTSRMRGPSMLSIGVEQIRRYWRLMWRDSPAPFLARLGATLCVVLMALRGATGLLRWLAWKAMNFLESHIVAGSFLATPRHFLEQVFRLEIGVHKTVCALSVPVAICAAVAFLRRPVGARRPSALRTVDSLDGVDPVLARRDSSIHPRIGEAFQGDFVGRLLSALARWEPGLDVCSENRCRDDIAFFLRQQGYQVAVERWIESNGERRRVDLVVDECVAIELKYELHSKGTGERDRAQTQVQRYAEIWGASGPVLLFLAGTPREGATAFGPPMEKWNATLDGAKSPILVLAD